MKNPYTQGAIALINPCPSCKYQRGLVIIRYEHDLGFVRCGKCDSALYSVSDCQVGEVANA